MSKLEMANLGFARGWNSQVIPVEALGNRLYRKGWKLGRQLATRELVVEPHTLVGCGCPGCRLVRIANA